jgi:hypothetical protein
MSGWITGATIGAGVLGVGASLYGANKQAKSNDEANRLNKEQFDAQQLQNWNNYLMQRGINPAGNTTVGGYGTGAPINSRLPLWASVARQDNPGPLRVVRRGTAGPARPSAGRLVATSPGSAQPAGAPPMTDPLAGIGQN